MAISKPAKEENVEALLGQMDFSADNVVSAAAQNPALFLRAIGYRIRCMRERNAAKMALESFRTDAELELRRKAREDGEKITERNLDVLLFHNENVAEAQLRFTHADEQDEYSKLVLEAFRMRRDCLRIVGDLTRDEFSLQKATEMNAERLNETRDKLRARFPGGK